MRIERELLRGAGPAAVLSLLKDRGQMYGYELIQALDASTNGVLNMGQSTLYPLLYNLEAKGLIESSWQTADSGRERKYYRITGKGKKRLNKDTQQLAALSDALARLGIVTAQPAVARLQR
jgi:PadR family transcriptional regulator PadR